MNRNRRSRFGAHVIEFALTLPAFTLLLAAIFDMGWLFYQQAMLDNAMHEGCRAGAVMDPETAGPEAVARDEILTLLARFGQPCRGDCSVEFEREGALPALYMTCKVDRDYNALFGMVPTPERIGSQTLIRFEWQDQIEAEGPQDRIVWTAIDDTDTDRTWENEYVD
ncbi:MAG: TadE/TadG family type IV pilus assembly protein [Myxococcota bacterium]